VLRPRDTYVLETPEGEERLRIVERRLKLRKTFAIERDGEEIATVAKALVSPLRDRFTVEVAGRGKLEAKGDLLDHEFTIEWEDGAAWPRSPSAGSRCATPTACPSPRPRTRSWPSRSPCASTRSSATDEYSPKHQFEA
jgi:hypothetical protein